MNEPGQITTDDGIRQIRLVWLGPKGLTLGFEWTYGQWLVCFMLGTGLAYLMGKTASNSMGFWYGVMFAIYGLVIGLAAGVVLMKRVTFDEPLHYKVLTFWHLFTTDRGARAPRPDTRLEIEWPTMAQLTIATTTHKESPDGITESTSEVEDTGDDYQQVVAKARRAI